SGRYRFRLNVPATDVAGRRMTLDVVADACTPRRMILDRSTWRPAGEPDVIPERRIARTGAPLRKALPPAAPAAGSWPSFRGPQATGIAEKQNLPDKWDRATA